MSDAASLFAQSRWPDEIIDGILGGLEGSPADLAACSQVSRQLDRCATARLYRTIEVTGDCLGALGSLASDGTRPSTRALVPKAKLVIVQAHTEQECRKLHHPLAVEFPVVGCDILRVDLALAPVDCPILHGHGGRAMVLTGSALEDPWPESLSELPKQSVTSIVTRFGTLRTGRTLTTKPIDLEALVIVLATQLVSLSGRTFPIDSRAAQDFSDALRGIYSRCKVRNVTIVNAPAVVEQIISRRHEAVNFVDIEDYRPLWTGAMDAEADEEWTIDLLV